MKSLLSILKEEEASVLHYNVLNSSIEGYQKELTKTPITQEYKNFCEGRICELTEKQNNLLPQIYSLRNEYHSCLTATLWKDYREDKNANN